MRLASVGELQMRRLGERESIRSSDTKLRLKLVTGRVLT